MSENEFNILKGMINELSDAFKEFQEKALSMIGKNDTRITRLEQICEDETNYKKRFWDNFWRLIPIILTGALVIEKLWGK